MAVGLVTGTYRELQGLWKTTPKTCGKQEKISAGRHFGSERSGVFHGSGRGCVLPRSRPARPGSSIHYGRDDKLQNHGEAGRKSLRAKALSYRNGENSVKATCRG